MTATREINRPIIRAGSFASVYPLHVRSNRHSELVRPEHSRM